MFRSTSLSHCTPTFVTPGLDPGVHRIMVSCEEMDCRVKPGKDDRKVACKRTEHAFKQKARRGFLRRCVRRHLVGGAAPGWPWRLSSSLRAFSARSCSCCCSFCCEASNSFGSVGGP